MVRVGPSVSVTIAQWGKVSFTERCVAALLASQYEGEIEVIVYDNGSPGGPGEVGDSGEVELIRGSTNIGFGPAHNLMAERAHGDLLLILNNDTIVTPAAIGRMVDALVSSGVGAVTPRYIGFEGGNLELGGYVGTDGQGWQLFRDRRPPQCLCRTRFVADYGSAACLLIERSLFLECGGFDDAYAPAYYEDTDLCFQLEQRGLRVEVEPRAVVYHYEGGTAGRDIGSGLKQLQEEHREVFADRWEPQLAARALISQDQAMAKALGLEGHSVLWITPEMPRPDHEAGHARMVSMLRTLKSTGSTVALWAEMAPEWDRYGRLLDEEGVWWFVHRLSGRLGGRNHAEYSSVQDLVGIGSWDVVVISFPEMAERIMPVVRELAPEIPVLIDAVDLHFLRMGRDPATDNEAVRSFQERELAVYDASDGVITAGVHELDVLIDHLPGTPAWSYTSVSTISVGSEGGPAEDGDVVFLGNFNHGPNLAAVEFWVDEIFPRMAPDTRRPLVVYGSGSDRHLGRWPEEAVIINGWAPDLRTVFDGARCFVAPLTYGAGSKGKILEAAAAGIPVITTSVGAEGYTGLLRDSLAIANQPAEMAETIGSLLSDRAAWLTACEEIRRGALDWRLRAEVEQSEFAGWVRRRWRMHASTPPVSL